MHGRIRRLDPLISPDGSALLVDVANGTRVTVIRVEAGMEAKRRLANLGVVPGVEIRKRQAAPMHGPVEIEVRGSILAIGRGIASKIRVMVEGG